MHPIDIGLIVLLLAGAIIGYKLGLISSVLSLVGLALSFVLIVTFSPMVEAGLRLRLSFSHLFASVIAKILIVLLIVLLVAIIKILINYIGKSLDLNFINRLLGAIFSIGSIYVIVLLLLFFIDMTPVFREFRTYLTNSKIINDSYRIVSYAKKDINELLPSNMRR